MAKPASSSAASVFVLVAVLFCRHVANAQCPDQWAALKRDCQKFVAVVSPAPLPPSQQCCATVQSSNLTCACLHVDPVLRQKVSMEKVAAVAADCGRPLTPGSKCGDYTIPGPNQPPGGL